MKAAAVLAAFLLVPLQQAAGGTTTRKAPGAPTNLHVTAATGSSVSVAWQAAKVKGSSPPSGYDVYRNGIRVATTTSTAYSFSSLSCGTSYAFGVVAFNSGGYRSQMAQITASTTLCAPTPAPTPAPAPAPAPPPASPPPPAPAPSPDATAPSIPGGVAVSSSSGTTISLGWNASTDNVGVAGYGLYRNGSAVGSTAGTTYTFSGLACGTSYTLGVDAFDAAGNRSSAASVTAGTSACPDTSAPTAPTLLTPSGATATSLSFAWNPSFDNVGVAGYGIYSNGSRVATTTGMNYTLVALTCGTSYVVGVDAYDAAGNRSPQTSLTLATAPCPTPTTPTFYVSPSGNNTDGASWATAWSDTSKISWSKIPDGATIYLDGGSSTCSVSPYDFASSSPNPGVNCGVRYSPFSIGHGNVTITKSATTGHNGTVVVDGGRDTPLPYCGQATYSAATGASYGINFQSYSGVTIDGVKRGGIVVRGAQNGIRMGPGGNETLRNLELFDNGYPTSHSYGYNTDGNDILMGGQNNTYDRLLVHDGGQDEFHSDSSGYSEAGSKVTNTWMGAMRAHPSYPGEPFNDLQASGHDPGCTHADGIQIFAPGTTMSGLTIDHDVFGPGINQGLYPSDSGTGTTFNNVSVTNSLFLDVASHNIISDNPVNGWTVDHNTLFATQGGFELPSNGVNTITNTIKSAGYVYTVGGTWATAGNDWWGGDPLPATSANVNPNFSSAPTGTLPGLTTLRAADLTSSTFPSTGSPIHSWSALLSRIDSLNG